MPSRPPWAWSPISPGESDASRLTASIVNERLSDLEAYLRRVHEEVTFGPVPGAYLSFHLSDRASVTLSTGGISDAMGLAFEMRPIFVSAFCLGGDVTVRLRESTAGAPTSVMSADIALVGGTVQTFDERGDFALEKITGAQIELFNVSVDSGSPYYVRVDLIAKNLSKIEPA